MVIRLSYMGCRAFGPASLGVSPQSVYEPVYDNVVFHNRVYPLGLFVSNIVAACMVRALRLVCEVRLSGNALCAIV
jgi:hypothetical protein